MPQQQQNVTATITSARAYGAIYWATPAATSNATNTPILLAGTTAAHGTANKITQGTANRLTFTGASARTFFVLCSVGISAAAATVSKIHLYKNGAVITGSTVTRAFSNTDIGAFAISAIVDVAPNEYVELWGETNDGDDLTVQNGVFSMQSID